jgi:hypothetical protein
MQELSASLHKGRRTGGNQLGQDGRQGREEG